ncbi:hypothetical protein N9V96_03355, partial [Polaribacter sp.]|nr:hypothetical protein [Polaribacter sp.]
IKQKKAKQVLNSKIFLKYLFCATPGITFLLWRYLTFGYITNPNSPWASYGNLVDIKYFIKNVAVLIWRYIDFGRVFLMLFLLYVAIKFGKQAIKNKSTQELFLVAIIPVFFIIVTILMITNTVGLRYFIVSYICLNLLTFFLLITFFLKKKLLYSILILGLLSGNLWIYPKTLSQSWHNTLALTPYHSLRLEAIDYLNYKKIDIEKTASFFPNYTSLDLIDLKGDKRLFLKFTGEEKYVFYSNVYNLKDEERIILHNNYNLLKEFNKFNITIKIYILRDK